MFAVFSLPILFVLLSASVAKAAVGTVLSVEGRPMLTLKQNASHLSLSPGLGVAAGDAIDTDQSSRAKVHLIDETIMDVHPSSRVLVPRLIAPDSPERMVLIEIERGKVRAKVSREVDRTKGRFQVHTYAATLGVEGTDFVVEVIPPDANGITKTTIAVLEGQVGVFGAKDGNDRITLPAGSRYTAIAKVVGEAVEQDKFKPEDIQKLNDGEMRELSRVSRLDNETFLQAISLAGGPGFGASTLQAITAGVQADRIESGGARAREDVLFRKRFRDDDLNERSNLVTLTIGFPP